EGFNEDDFDFLPADERKELSESVKQFLEAARGVGPKDRPTDLQIQQALPPFTRIVEILGGNKYADPEAFLLGKRIEREIANQLPASVLELRFETGEDASGGEALWIWVVFKDDVAQSKEVLLSNIDYVREALNDAVGRLGIKRWP